jgi:hypothetical protein
MKTGSKVRYIANDTQSDKESGFFPPVGTVGTVTHVTEDGAWVKWNAGTKKGSWFCFSTDLEEIKAPIAWWQVAIYAAVAAFWAWLVISVVDVNITNLPDNPAVPAAWNFFEVLTRWIK